MGGRGVTWVTGVTENLESHREITGEHRGMHGVYEMKKLKKIRFCS
jgi:hypothetical protein